MSAGFLPSPFCRGYARAPWLFRSPRSSTFSFSCSRLGGDASPYHLGCNAFGRANRPGEPQSMLKKMNPPERQSSHRTRSRASRRLIFPFMRTARRGRLALPFLVTISGRANPLGEPRSMKKNMVRRNALPATHLRGYKCSDCIYVPTPRLASAHIYVDIHELLFTSFFSRLTFHAGCVIHVNAMNTIDLSALLVRARKAQGIRQKELAELAGVGETVVYKLEAGRRDVTLSNFVSVLGSLGFELVCRSPLGEETRLER
jgi:DNA-binding XRE family transcriptional regulator